MRLWNRLPETVLQMLPGDSGRLLAYGELAPPIGGFAAATKHMLVWPSGNADPQPAASIWVAWDDVVTARWSQDCLDVVQRTVAGIHTNHRLRFDRPGAIPEVVRERISWTVVSSHIQTLTGAGTDNRMVLLTARRSTRDAAIRWVASFDPQAGPVTAAQSQAAAMAHQQLAAQLGIG